MSVTKTFPKDEYTVGWICALDIEMAAAEAMLDEIHGDLEETNPSDLSSYTLGRVQDHKVVITCLPAGIYGTNAAATCAKDMLRTFKAIRTGLMVGIGGGIPSDQHDIRLGDIVVSQLSGTSGGVIRYDLGKAVGEGEFRCTGTLNTPPKSLLTSLQRIKARHRGQDSRVPSFLVNMIKENPKMKAEYTYRGAANDHLYETVYDHPPGARTCENCGSSKEVIREPRTSLKPRIH